MGTYSDWLTHNIPDPASIDAELYLALSALDTVIDQLSSADHIAFSDDSFFSALVTNVGEALREIGDYLAAGGTGSGSARGLVVIPTRDEALVDATDVFSFLCHKTGVLGMARAFLTTAPVGAAAVFQIMKNAATMYEFSFDIGVHGPLELDLSFIPVVVNDLVGLRCITASSAKGLAVTLEY
jgi:hypothetical protein